MGFIPHTSQGGSSLLLKYSSGTSAAPFGAQPTFSRLLRTPTSHIVVKCFLLSVFGYKGSVQLVLVIQDDFYIT